MNNQKKKMKKKHNISLLSRKLTLLSANLSKTRNLSLAFLPQFHIDFKDTYHRLKGTSIHFKFMPNNVHKQSLSGNSWGFTPYNFKMERRKKASIVTGMTGQRDIEEQGNSQLLKGLKYQIELFQSVQMTRLLPLRDKIHSLHTSKRRHCDW